MPLTLIKKPQLLLPRDCTCSDLVADLYGNLSRDNVVTCANGLLPHVRRPNEVLVLDVDEVLGAPDLRVQNAHGTQFHFMITYTYSSSFSHSRQTDAGGRVWGSA
jgi:hypothetical protein